MKKQKQSEEGILNGGKYHVVGIQTREYEVNAWRKRGIKKYGTGGVKEDTLIFRGETVFEGGRH